MPFRREQREAILKAAHERGQRADNLQKRLIAAREAKLDTIEQQLKQLYVQSMMDNEQAETPRVRLHAPNWYVNMTGVLRPERPQSPRALVMGKPRKCPRPWFRTMETFRWCYFTINLETSLHCG